MNDDASSGVDAQLALKRQWLERRGILRPQRRSWESPGRLALAPAEDEPSGPPVAEDIEATLSQIEDDAWVLKVCLAEIDHAADGDYDADLRAVHGLRAVLHEGIKRTGHRTDLKAFLEQLDLRLQACSASSSQGDVEDVEVDAEADAWDVEAQGDSTGEVDNELSLYLQPSLVDVASSLIISKQYGRVSALVQLPPLAAALLGSKASLVKLMLISCEEREDIEVLRDQGLLPGLGRSGAEESEGPAWHALDAPTEEWYGGLLVELRQERRSSAQVLLAVLAALQEQGVLEDSSQAAQNLQALRQELELEGMLALAPQGDTPGSASGAGDLSLQNAAGLQRTLLAILDATDPTEIAATCGSSIFPVLQRVAASAGGERQVAAAIEQHLTALCLSLLSTSEPRRRAGRFARSLALLHPNSGLHAHISRSRLLGLLLVAAYAQDESAADGETLETLAQLLQPWQQALSDPSFFAQQLAEAQGSSTLREPPTAETIFALSQALDARAFPPILAEAGAVTSVLAHLARWGASASASWLAATNTEPGAKKAWLRKVLAGSRTTVHEPAAWTALLAMMVGPAGRRTLWPLQPDEVLARIAQSCYEAGYDALASSWLSSRQVNGLALPSLDEAQAEDLRLRAIRALYSRATTANHHRGELRIAHSLASPSSRRLKQERDFIEATSKLGSYKLPSRQHGEALPLLPPEIRATQDRMQLVALLLSINDDAYKAWESILDLAVKLCAGEHASVDGEDADDHDGESKTAESRAPSPQQQKPKVLIQIQALGMLSDSAIAAEDFARAQDMARNMIGLIDGLRRRAAAAAAASKRVSFGTTQSEGAQSDSTSTAAGAAPPMSASEMLPEAEEIGWKACYQLARHPAFTDDDRQKLQLMGHAVSLCPREQIATMTQQWQKLYAQIESNRAAAHVNGGAGQAGQTRTHVLRGEDALFFVAEKTAGSTRASGGGLGSLVDAYTSPFASLLANAGARAASVAAAADASGRIGRGSAAHGGRNGGTGVAAAGLSGGGGLSERAAHLLDSLGSAQHGGGGGGGGHSFDPAERAARAARHLFGLGRDRPHNMQAAAQGGGDGAGAVGGPQHATGAPGGPAFSLSRGVGWLLGEEERQRRN